jgi:predicted dehydrogenase
LSSSQPVETVLCGIGGYGEFYLDRFFGPADSPIRFVGFVDPSPEHSRFRTPIRDAGIPVHASLEEFYATRDAALAILASPIQHHGPQIMCAFERGSNVLCEKPLCGTTKEACRLLDAQRQSGLVAAVGYQFAFTSGTQRLKADIMEGVWGRPIRLKCLAHGPRSREYYLRNGWAGRVRDEAGRWILDSPVNNAMSHYLHLMLYLLGDAADRGAVPVDVQAQLYRAHKIENYDTAFIRATLPCEAEVIFVTSHLGTGGHGPLLELEFERGTIRFDSGSSDMVGRFDDGGRRDYASVFGRGHDKVLDTLAAIAQGREPLCGIAAAMCQTLCMDGAQKSGTPVVEIPHDLVTEVEDAGQRWLAVPGLEELLLDAFERAELPDSSWASWITQTRTVALNDCT